MPDAACTGVPAGVTLHSCSGNLTSGVYDSCLFSGDAYVTGNNVTIIRSRVLGKVSGSNQYSSSRNLQLIDVEIDGGSNPTSEAAIGEDGWSCLRCNIHNTGRGANFGTNVTIRDSYFHDFTKVGDSHMSAAGSNGGNANTIVHNVFDCPVPQCSGAFVMYGDWEQISNVLVQNNLLASPGSYCTYAGSVGGKPYPHATSVRYVDNRFSYKYTPVCGLYGPVTSWEWNAGNVWSGNAFTDGKPVTV